MCVLVIYKVLVDVESIFYENYSTASFHFITQMFTNHLLLKKCFDIFLYKDEHSLKMLLCYDHLGEDKTTLYWFI